jgi:hypothetical protein
VAGIVADRLQWTPTSEFGASLFWQRGLEPTVEASHMRQQTVPPPSEKENAVDRSSSKVPLTVKGKLGPSHSQSCEAQR